MPEFRLLSHAYDGDMQWEFSDWNNETKFRRLLGRMRLDGILYDKIVLIDSELFDGIFFLYAAQTEQRFSLLPWSRIEIKARSKALSDAFLRQIRRPGLDRLVGYMFWSLPPSDAPRISRELEKTKSTEVKDLRALTERLIKLGVDAGYAERHLAGWQNLIAFTQKHSIRPSEWSTIFDFPRGFEYEITRLQGAVYEGLKTEIGRKAFRVPGKIGLHEIKLWRPSTNCRGEITKSMGTLRH